MGLGPCARLPDAPLHHYAVQQHLYAAILRRAYGLRVDELRLLQLHPGLPAHRYLRVPDLLPADLADALLDARATGASTAADVPQRDRPDLFVAAAWP